MRAAAARDGLDIGIVSAFRDFDAQARIGNLKYRGERPLYGRDGTPRSRDTLPAGELIDAVHSGNAPARDEILARLPRNFSRYIANADPPDRAVLATAV